MIKVYKTNRGALSTPILVGGKIIRIDFESTSAKSGVYSTSDKELQEAIERDSNFGNKIYLKEILGAELEEDVELPKEGALKVVDSITDYQSAKDFLRKEYEIPHQSLNTPENILKKAAEAGVLFPNLKGE